MNTYTSTRYENISKNMNEIVDELLKNKSLLRWITYLDDDPLSEEKPDVKLSRVLGKKIVLTKVNESILTEAEGIVFITPKGGAEKRNQKGVLADTIFEVNIAMPNHLSYSYPLRTDRFSTIASEIAKTLDGKNITGVGETRVSTSFNTYKINEIYTAMMLYINVTNSIIGKLDVDYGRQ